MWYALAVFRVRGSDCIDGSVLWTSVQAVVPRLPPHGCGGEDDVPVGKVRERKKTPPEYGESLCKVSASGPKKAAH